MDWYPWYPYLYQYDTMHLTVEQDGIYRRLIDWYMISRRPLPNSDAAIASAARISLDQIAPHLEVIRAFFTVKAGFLHLKRCDEVLDDQDARSSKQSEIARIAAKARWKNNNNLDASSMLEACSTDAGAMLLDATRQDKTRHKIGYSPEFEKLWEVFPPQRKGSKDKAFIAFKRAMTRSSVQEILEGVGRYIGSDEVAKGFAKGCAAWLNDDRWKSDYTHSKPNGHQLKKIKATEALRMLVGAGLGSAMPLERHTYLKSQGVDPVSLEG